MDKTFYCVVKTSIIILHCIYALKRTEEEVARRFFVGNVSMTCSPRKLRFFLKAVMQHWISIELWSIIVDVEAQYCVTISGVLLLFQNFWTTNFSRRKVTVKQRLQSTSVKEPLINPRRRIRKAQAVLARPLLLRRQYPSERRLEEAKKGHNLLHLSQRTTGDSSAESRIKKKQVGYMVSRPFCFTKRRNHSGWKLKKIRITVHLKANKGAILCIVYEQRLSSILHFPFFTHDNEGDQPIEMRSKWRRTRNVLVYSENRLCSFKKKTIFDYFQKFQHKSLVI